jgi:hypothetical protein
MGDWNSADPRATAEGALAKVEEETRKLGELGKHWDEASTTVRARDHSFEMTFDGRGELAELVFNSAKYRAMPPAQLAQIIIETLREGRAQAQQKANDLMGFGDIPGLDLDGLVSGQVRPDEMLNALMAPMLQTMQEFGVDVDGVRQQVKNDKREERDHG